MGAVPGLNAGLQTMTSGEQGTRRLQTLYDRQRPRLRERVLQQCQARGCATVNVNHLDLVLDNQRNQLTDSADLNIVSLERQALQALGFDSGPAAEGTGMAASHHRLRSSNMAHHSSSTAHHSSNMAHHSSRRSLSSNIPLKTRGCTNKFLIIKWVATTG